MRIFDKVKLALFNLKLVDYEQFSKTDNIIFDSKYLYDKFVEELALEPTTNLWFKYSNTWITFKYMDKTYHVYVSYTANLNEDGFALEVSPPF